MADIILSTKIAVTDDDIMHGKPNECVECPIGLALKRDYPDLDYSVGNSEITVYGSMFGRENQLQYYHVPLPVEAIAFISAFDAHKPVEPFSFVIPDYLFPVNRYIRHE